MRKFKQIGVRTSGKYSFPKFRKPVKSIKTGDIIKLTYQDGNEDIIMIKEELQGTCVGCMYSESDVCPVYISKAMGEVCLAGPRRIAVSINKILEEL